MTPTRLHRSESAARPLSFAQERLWFLDQINPGDPSANVCRAFRIKGEVRTDFLKQSLQAVINRHESLRTTFATTQLYAGVDSKPVQLVAKECSVELPLIDLAMLPAEQRDAKARELARAEAQRNFDLSLGPLLRATLLKLDAREHVLILTLHRIVCDEESLNILLRDLGEYYRAARKNEDPQLPSLPVQFADYAAWQQETAKSGQFDVHSHYWKEKLSGAPVATELPTASGRPAIQSWRGGSVSFQIQPPLYETLKSLDDPFTTLTAAFQLLISRYSGQQDVVIGSTLANRELAETKDLVGPLANAIALRTDLSGNPTFSTLLERTKKEIVAAREHGLLPFEKLIDELEVERSLSHAPVFQISIDLKRKTDFSAWGDELSIEEFELEIGIAALDLKLEIVENKDHIHCRFEYAAYLFDQTTVKRFAEHFVRLLAKIARNPEERVGHFTFLSREELKKILHEWNNTSTPRDPSETFCELFESQVQRTPHAVAVEFGETSLTYEQLNTSANQLAHYLQAHRVGPEKLVGLFIERSLEMVVALLGILKVGAAYLPLETEYPAERLRFILNDSGAPILVTTKSLSDRIRQLGTDARIVCLDAEEEEIAAQSRENPRCQVRPENLVYAIYTSGSTGKPKGTLITHRGLTNYLNWAIKAYPLREGKGAPVHSSIAFDLTVTGLFTPLLVGRTAYLCETSASSAPPRLISTAETQSTQRSRGGVESLSSALKSVQGFSLIKITPAHLELLSYELTREEAAECASAFIIGGENLTADSIKFWQDAAPNTLLVNEYGPTETVVGCCVYTVRKEDVWPRSIPIGRPIANTQLYVLSPDLQPQPLGVPGELYIGGAGLARGYLKQPELTAERFVPDPFGTEPGARLYKTGDKVVYLEDGNIEFLGRLDHQVKLRGYRIELGEIETVLNSHPLVSQSVVIITPDSTGEQRLIAYFVPDAEAGSSANGIERQLRDHLRTRLPEYMVPQNLMMLEALPLTPNGKIDRRLLPQPEFFTRAAHATYVAPRDNLEKQIAAMWEAVLGTQPIGAKDNFFDLGGHSLLAARLFAQIENRVGKHIPLATLFQAPTVEQLSNVLRDSKATETWSSLVTIQAEGSKPPLFCVHAAGANVLIYRPLSRHLGNDQPVYALQAQGLDGQTKPYTRVEDMAAHYIKEMRAFKPEGPYHLLGASFGGLVIYEMALQLAEQGQKVGLLAMLNTDCPVYTLRKRIMSHAVHLVKHGPRFYARGIMNGVTRRLKTRLPVREKESNNSERIAAPDPELQQLLESRVDTDEALVRTVYAIMKASEDYVPNGRIRDKITYFRAIDTSAKFDDNRLGWRHLGGGGFEVYDVPGTHTSMREEPHVAVLVEKLKPCLERAQLE